tara:strand:- start:192 stop:455 length:264 start_codon:yes stop_codon:yes gene_type:complete
MLIFNLIMNKNLPKSCKVVAIGIGAAIYFISGNKRLATKNLDYLSFVWPFRLISEPKRLFLGYFVNNTLFILFIFYFTIQYLKFKLK